MLAERLWHDGPLFSGGWNFGPYDNDAKPVDWIVNNLAQAWDGRATWSIDEGHHPYEASYLKLDISKSCNELKWRPCWPLEQSLKHILDWYAAHHQGRDMRALTLEQIRQYEEQTIISEKNK